MKAIGEKTLKKAYQLYGGVYTRYNTMQGKKGTFYKASFLKAILPTITNLQNVT